mgnify:CR=1 FL=1
MKRTTIRELKHATSKVLSLVEQGECVEVRRHNRPVAVLTPIRTESPKKRPDFRGRLEAIYGGKVQSVTGTDLVSELRGER